MYFMSEHEIRWTNTLYPQYQLYEHRLSSFIDRSWPISLHQNEVTMANAGFFYSGYGDIVICAFCGLYLHRWLPNDEPITEHKKFNRNCKVVSLFQNDNQSTIQYHGLFMKIKSVCYNVITFLISTFSNLKNLIYFYFQKNLVTNFLVLVFIVYAKYVLRKNQTPYYYHVTMYPLVIYVQSVLTFVLYVDVKLKA